MIEFIKDRPNGNFNHLSNSCFWFNIRNGQDVYAVGALEPLDTVLGVHLEVRKWNHTALRTMETDWQEIVRFARSMNYKTLVVSNRNINDEKWPRFISHFGFPEPYGVLISHQEV